MGIKEMTDVMLAYYENEETIEQKDETNPFSEWEFVEVPQWNCRGDEILKEAEEFTKKKFPKVKKFIVYAEKKWINEWYERLGYEHVGFDKKEQMDKLIKKL